MRIVSIEEHFAYEPVTRYCDVLDLFRKYGNPACDKLPDVASGRLADMDRAGIDYQLLSLLDPGVQELDAKTAVPLAREANDFLAQMIAQHPDRFGGFATLATQDPASAAEELERCVRKLNFKGAMINGRSGDRYLDDPSSWAIFERAEELNVPIYLHPTTPHPDVLNTYFKDYAEVGLHLASWGFAVETSCHVLKLIYAGVFDKFPRLQMILGHMGELLPFGLWRLDRYYLPTAWYRSEADISRSKKLQLKPSEYIRRNFHITTSGNFSFPPLLCSILELGADKIMFSVDYPMDVAIDGVTFLKNAPISDADRVKIAHENADRLFGLAKPAPALSST
jgi:2,3-dihydroxybenzoate decarboxylase